MFTLFASVYEAFLTEEAHRLARRARNLLHPRNGSWLNVTEIELSVLQEQCLKPQFTTFRLTRTDVIKLI